MPTIAPALRIPAPTQGVRPDLHPTEVPPDALAAAENWLRYRGQFRVRRGVEAFANSVAARPTRYIQYTYHDASTRIVQATVTGWWRFDAGSEQWIDITDPGLPLTASPTNLQVFRTFSKAGATWLLGVNGKDAPKKWDGASATYANLGGSPPVARTMMVLADRVLLGNLLSGDTISPVGVDVSALLDFDAGWGAVLVALLAETPGEIVAMEEMGYFQGVIYKEDAISLAIAQAGEVPFRFEFKQRVPGPVSSAAVATLSDGVHAYLARDGAIRLFDGVSARSLGLHIQRHIADRMMLANAGRAWVAWDSDEQILYAAWVPVGGVNPTQGVAITLPSADCYPIRWDRLQPTAAAKLLVPAGLTIGEMTGRLGDMPATLGEFDTTAQRFLLGDVSGQSYREGGTTDDGVPIPAFFQTGLSDFGSRRRWKTLQEIEHFFERTLAPQPVNVRIGISDSGEAPTFVDEIGGYGVPTYGPVGYFGFGAGATGGREGEVYRVTTLADDGPGSLRDAVSQPDRWIVFDVAGTITLQSALLLHGNTTVDGFSAPAPGITLTWADGIASSGLWIRAQEQAHNVIVRYLRIRNSQASGGDGIRIAGAHDVVIDHCSISGWLDGGIDITDDQSTLNVPAYNITISWNLIHRVGGARGSLVAQFEALPTNLRNISFHHNLFYATSRLPQINWLQGAGETPEAITVDFRNNLVWGWGSGEATRVQHGAKANVVNNFYYSGEDSLSNNRDDSVIVDTATNARAYVAGNKNRFSPSVDAQINAVGTEVQPFPVEAAPETVDACVAAELVLAGAGCRRPDLDAEDQAVLDTISTAETCTPSDPAVLLAHLPPDPSDEAGPPYGADNAIDLAAPPYRTQHGITARLFTLRIDCEATQDVIYEGSDPALAERGLR